MCKTFSISDLPSATEARNSSRQRPISPYLRGDTLHLKHWKNGRDNLPLMIMKPPSHKEKSVAKFAAVE